MSGEIMTFPPERRWFVALIEALHELRWVVEHVDDLDPFRDPMVLDDLQTITAILEVEERAS